MDVFLEAKNFHKNNLFSYVKKQKKLLTALMLTPLLAACNESIFFPSVPIPSDAELTADGYVIHRSTLFDGDDVFFGGGAKDAIIGLFGDDIFEGGDGDDLIFGQDGNDILEGRDGNDNIYGGSGADDLFGGNGDDYLAPGNDNVFDFINGGAGNDTVSYQHHSGYLSISLITDEVSTNGVFSDELLSIENVVGALNHENDIFGNDEDNILTGGNQDDYIDAGGGEDVLFGLGGEDELSGRAGDDIIYGGDGDDDLSGGADNDTLNGGKGSDSLSGGSGEDIFAFTNEDLGGSNSVDTIEDFVFDTDRIDFSELDYINNFDDVESNIYQFGDDTYIDLDADGDHVLQIEDQLATKFIDGDFIFIV